MVFYTHWGNIRLTSCFCGIAHIDALYRVLHACRQYQANVLLLWDRAKSCFLLCFTHTLRQYHIQYSYLCMFSLRVGLRVGCAYAWAAIRIQPAVQRITFWQAAVGVLGQHATQRCPRLTNCFCAIAQIHACHCVLHALGQYQTNELLLWDRPTSCSLP